MKTALIGFGQMGQMLFKLAPNFKIDIVSIIDPTHPQANSKEISECALKGATVCIDFTHPTSVLENVSKLASLKKNILIGTTGWEKFLPDVQAYAKKDQIGILHGSNFSTGVFLFKQLVQKAIEEIEIVEEYKASVIEIHHTKKKDAPSGTAKEILKLFSNPIEVQSKRIGEEIGEHRVLFDCPFDQIELVHRAKSREVFALGALRAALWLDQKVGFFQFEDVVQEILKGVYI